MRPFSLIRCLRAYDRLRLYDLKGKGLEGGVLHTVSYLLILHIGVPWRFSSMSYAVHPYLVLIYLGPVVNAI